MMQEQEKPEWAECWVRGRADPMPLELYQTTWDQIEFGFIFNAKEGYKDI